MEFPRQWKEDRIRADIRGGDCPKTQKSIPKVEDSAQYAITNRDDVISKNGLRFILV